MSKVNHVKDAEMQTSLLWCVFTSLVCEIYTQQTINSANGAWSKRTTDVEVTPIQRRMTCPQYWVFKEQYNVCLGPIGEFVNAATHKRTCEQQHSQSQLATTQNQADVDDVCDFGNTFFPSEAGYFYIGAERINGTFKWLRDGTPVDMKINWAQGEPNGTLAKPQNCLVISMSPDQNKACKFYDMDCDKRLPAVCQILDAYPCDVPTNGGCEQLCIVTDARMRVCACHPGYTEVMETSCVEKDECLIQNGGCDHICTNLPGKYECSCHEGYEKVNNWKCEDSTNSLCNNLNGGCHHYCSVKDRSIECSCMEGYIMYGNSSKCYADNTEEALSESNLRYILYVVLPIVSAILAITFMVFILVVGIKHDLDNNKKKKLKNENAGRLYHGMSMEVKVGNSRIGVGKYHRKYGTSV